MRFNSLTGCVVVVALATAATAQDFEGLLGGELGRLTPRVNYQVRSYFDAEVEKQREKLHMVRHEVGVSLPVLQDRTQEWTLFTRATAYDVDTGARLPFAWNDLPHPRPELPNRLWDVRVGTSYRRQLSNGWVAGGSVAVGSASDRLFASGEEWLADASGFVRIPQGERDHWLLLINYSGNRQFLPHVPLPGVGYLHHPNDTLRLLAGFPWSSVRWEPLERLALEASYFFPRVVHAEASYRVIEPVKLYVAFDWDNDRFLRADRQDADDRLFYDDKRVAAGVRWTIIEQLELDFSGGWSFDRYFFEGESYDDRNERRIDIADAPMLMLELRYRL